jgi:ribonuclease HII
MADGHRFVAGVDEVGTGSCAGPCYCAVVVVDATTGPVPEGLHDSKLLRPTQRELLVPLINDWAVDAAIGTASAEEIDTLGLTAALRRAGERAFAALRHTPDVVILDGKRDWLHSTTVSFLDGATPPTIAPVRTRVKADQFCASVAAASVLAKVARDALMDALAEDEPHYGWETNKGYGTAAHLAAIEQHGLSAQHRRSWRFAGSAE